MTAVRKMSISIPSELAERLEPWRERMNVSGVCADAIRREIEILEAAFQSPNEDDQYTEVIERLRSQLPTDHDYQRGFEHGKSYAQDEADYEEFKEYEGISLSLEHRLLDSDELTLPHYAEKNLQDELRAEWVYSGDSYRRGFVAGMMEVWEQVKDRL